MIINQSVINNSNIINNLKRPNENFKTKNDKFQIQNITYPNKDDNNNIKNSDNDNDKDNKADEYKPQPTKKKKKQIPENDKKIKLRNVSLICDRFGTSDREAAAIVSAAFKSLVVDRSKLRRDRKKERNESI